MKKIISETIGWYGTVAVLVAYFLVSLSFLNSNNLIYQTLNITGSIGLCWISYKKKITQLTIFYAIWAVIGIISFIGILI